MGAQSMPGRIPTEYDIYDVELKDLRIDRWTKQHIYFEGPTTLAGLSAHREGAQGRLQYQHPTQTQSGWTPRPRPGTLEGLCRDSPSNAYNLLSVQIAHTVLNIHKISIHHVYPDANRNLESYIMRDNRT